MAVLKTTTPFVELGKDHLISKTIHTSSCIPSFGSVAACFHSYVAPLDASKGGDSSGGAGRIVKPLKKGKLLKKNTKH